MVCAITSPKNKSIGKYFFHRPKAIHPKASTHETWAGDNLKVATMIGFVIGNPLLEIVIFFEGFHFPSCDLLNIEHEIKHMYQ